MPSQLNNPFIWPLNGCSISPPLHRTGRNHSGHLKGEEMSHTKHLQKSSSKGMRYSLPSVSLVLRPPPSRVPYSVSAKLHLVALQPLCLSGWFTLRWPEGKGKGGGLLPGPHYQLLATGTRSSWQTRGRSTLHRNSTTGRKKSRLRMSFFFYILHLRIHGSALMDFSDYWYCRCWISNFCMNSQVLSPEENFSHRRVRLALSSVSVCVLWAHMWRACQRQYAAPARGLSSAQWSIAVPSNHVPPAVILGWRCWQWLVSVSCAPLSSLHPLSPVLYFYLGPPLAAPSF